MRIIITVIEFVHFLKYCTAFPDKKKKVICKDALLGDKEVSFWAWGFISPVQRILEVVQLKIKLWDPP